MSFRGIRSRFINFLAWFAVVVGAGHLLLGLFDIISTQRFLWTALEAEVTVIGNEEKESEHGLLFRPTFAVLGQDESNIEYVGNLWLYPKPHETGEVVKGYYEPATGIIVSELMFRKKAGFGSFEMKFGSTFFLIGAAFLWWSRQRRQKVY